MKRHMIFAVITIYSLLLLSYLQWGRELNICNSRIDSFDGGYYENISLIANSIYIFDKEEFAEQIIQDIIDNSLKDILFSYDIHGYPNGLHITVYMNEYARKNGKSSFEISYSQDSSYNSTYNMKDNPDKFKLSIISGSHF